MKKKLLISLSLIVVLIAVFAISVSAAEYTVTTKDEFNTAYANAVDGDTIVIKADITTNFDFGKTITYILDGGVTWSVNGGYVNGLDFNTASGKTVSLYARNGTGVFYPNAGMWCNEGKFSNNFKETIWNIGSLDNSKMKLDLTAITGRLFYSSSFDNIRFKEINLLPNSVICNANKTAQDGTIMVAYDLNMYEGAEIYGNWSKNVIFDAKTFNMYGGKIYGNSCEYGNGFLNANNFYMYGGEIFMNYQTYSYGNGYGLINAINGLYIYGGSIHNNIGRATSKYGMVISANAGYNKQMFIYDESAIHDNYSTNNISLARNSENYYVEYDSTNNVWGTYDAVSKKYSGIEPAAENSVQFMEVPQNGSGMGFKVTVYDYSLIFRNADSSVINAYMIKDDGTVLKSVDGSTAITVPNSELGWTTKMNYCVVSSVDTSKQGTYYVAVDHKVTDDHNCETALLCDACQAVIKEAMTHALVDSIVYENGFLESGIQGIICQNEGCTAANETNEIDALFVFGGYSVPLEGEKDSIAYTVKVNYEMIKAYKELTGKAFKYGIVASSVLENKNPVLENGTPNEGSAMAELTGTEYSILKIRITNIDDPSQELHCCAYYIFDDKVMYIGKDGLSDKAESVKLNDFN